MKPRVKLLFVFSVIFALWVGMMLVMYFGTVYKFRHPEKLPGATGNSESTQPQ